ncbi:MAG: two-component regulator propeller domain-containing protein, partial [Pricia sp.]
SNSVWSLFNDRRERIWIGYYNEGVGINDRSYDKFSDIESLPSVSNSLQSGSVTGITKDGRGRFWIGMNGGGVDVYNPKNQGFVHLSDTENPIASGLTALDVQTVFMDSKDNFWVGTWNSGIFYLERDGKTFKNFNIGTTDGAIKSNRILSFAEDDQGVIWIGTFLNGLHSYHPETREFKFYDTPPFTAHEIIYADIRKVLVDSEGSLWLGTTRGLFKIERNGRTDFKVLPMTEAMYEPIGNGSGSHSVLSLFEDGDGNFWIGTDGDGLCKYDRQNDAFTWFGQGEGMEQETVSAITESGKHLWFGGNKGLSKLDIESGSLVNFTKQDGLLANDFNNNSVFKDDDGSLYFGSYKGVNYFMPGTIPLNQNSPTLYFSALKLFNKSVEPGAKGSPLQNVLSQTPNLKLGHDQSVFTIDYVGINYTRPEQNEYAYMLEGFEDAYNYVGNSRSATYTNLPKGNYVFKVKAANNDGLWNEDPISLPIEIVPPWWATNLAIACYFIATLLLLFLAYRIFYDRIKERRMIKLERERRVQEEALNDRKIQFFTNISHEFRTPLTLITNPLADIMDDTGTVLPKKVRDKHRVIQKNTARLSRLVDELLDFRKLQLDKMPVRASRIDAVPFVREITDYFEDEALQRNILLSVESDAEELIVWSDAGMLEKIVFNILSNAFKATPENGAVSVSVSSCDSNVAFPLIDNDKLLPAMEILITDTGSGIKKKELDHIFERFYQAEEMNQQYYGGTGIGLEVVRNFVALHKGKIEVDSEEKSGTAFKIILPLGNEHFEFKELFLKKESAEALSEEMEDIPMASEETVDKTSTKKNTLLLVEDNAELRSYLKDALKRDYIITEAANGKEALALAGKLIPDIIVTDVVMPEMDGKEFCTRLRDDLKTSHIPVLMLSAKAMGDDLVEGIEAGADVYLSKPFEMKVLQSQLKQLILNRQLLFNKYFGGIVKTGIDDSGNSLDKDFITKVLKYVHANIDDPNLNVENLADELQLSRSQLYRKIKALTGQTANQFLRAVRLEKSKEMILEGNDSIGEISFKVGFSSPSYFTSCFKSHFGILPTEVKETVE